MGWVLTYPQQQGVNAWARQKAIMVKARSGKKQRPAAGGVSPAAGSAAAGPAASVAQLDAQLLALVQQRAAAFIESANRQPEPAASEAGPDQQHWAALVERQAGLLPPLHLQAILREVASGCRALVHQTRVAYLGPPYSYSHLAAIHRFGRCVEFIPVETIAAVFEEVNSRHAEFGLVPIENSTDGRIADTLDMFTRLPVGICGAVEMRIHHALLARCRRTEVKEIYSRPQALSQCRNWLAQHLPAARTIEVTSTSTAAQLAAEKPGAAAIASRQAGVEHGLDVLAENIEDNPGNTTRFAVIGGQPPARTGNDRTTILFQVEHRPGAWPRP